MARIRYVDARPDGVNVRRSPAQMTMQFSFQDFGTKVCIGLTLHRVVTKILRPCQNGVYCAPKTQT